MTISVHLQAPRPPVTFTAVLAFIRPHSCNRKKEEQRRNTALLIFDFSISTPSLLALNPRPYPRLRVTRSFHRGRLFPSPSPSPKKPYPLSANSGERLISVSVKQTRMNRSGLLIGVAEDSGKMVGFGMGRALEVCHRELYLR